jgi:hypothetical protein
VHALRLLSAKPKPVAPQGLIATLAAFAHRKQYGQLGSRKWTLKSSEDICLYCSFFLFFIGNFRLSLIAVAFWQRFRANNYLRLQPKQKLG